MGLLTIGAFSRASRLSPKALRLYDELGLLPPARVDPVSGYRFYDPAQLARARLVGRLRRLGMPLAEIRTVCELAPEAAAAEVAAFWARVEADTAARRDLAAFLVGHLSGEGPISIRCAALSDTGLVRSSNQDAAHADPRLLAVADGFGPAGAPASAAAIETFRRLPAGAVPAGDPLNVLQDTVRQADRAIREATAPANQAGTTLTAMLRTGSRLALVHIGDSRAYLLRNGELRQITHDHTLVQSLLDAGRITPEQAATHPQRELLSRALNGDNATTADLHLHQPTPGDRYLLCSDGLSRVVDSTQLHQAVRSAPHPEQAVHDLITLANEAGAPDNVTCVVAEVTAA